MPVHQLLNQVMMTTILLLCFILWRESQIRQLDKNISSDPREQYLIVLLILQMMNKPEQCAHTELVWNKITKDKITFFLLLKSFWNPKLGIIVETSLRVDTCKPHIVNEKSFIDGQVVKAHINIPCDKWSCAAGLVN